jgi:hypothetical protein
MKRRHDERPAPFSFETARAESPAASGKAPAAYALFLRLPAADAPRLRRISF